MKFMHIADIHLGAVPDKGHRWSKIRKEEIWRSFKRVVEEAEREKVDLLLIAGDLFHRQPLPGELKEVNYLLGRLTRTQVVLIAGNHDYLKKDSCYRNFPWEENVTFLDGRQCECVHFAGIHTTVYGFSYHSREITQPLYDNLHPGRETGCHILLAHGGDERHIPIDKKKLAESGFDYIALGHIHKPQSWAEGRAAYAGVLEPLEANETGAHGYVLGEYSCGRIQTCFVPFACREYIQLELESSTEDTDFSMRAMLEQSIKQHGEHNIYKVRILGFRDPDICYRTKQYSELGNILDITDETVPDYDFEALCRVHGNDIIGRYIKKLLDEGKMPLSRQEGSKMEGTGDWIRRKALYYGVQAMLNGGQE